MRRRVSMERTPEEKIEERLKNEFPPAISAMPGGPMISSVGRGSASSISISLSASRPSRRRFLITWRAVPSAR